jgi:hypothetical protein
MTEVNPLKLFGNHYNCKDFFDHCLVCEPKDEVAFVMAVGTKFYPETSDFLNEAKSQGISKRIPFIPKKLKIGKTVIYLAHNKAFEAKEPVVLQQAMGILTQSQPRLIDAEIKNVKLGIFSAFIPQRIEKLFWESEKTKKLAKDCKKQGITPVWIKDGDIDHK